MKVGDKADGVGTPATNAVFHTEKPPNTKDAVHPADDESAIKLSLEREATKKFDVTFGFELSDAQNAAHHGGMAGEHAHQGILFRCR